MGGPALIWAHSPRIKASLTKEAILIWVLIRGLPTQGALDQGELDLGLDLGGPDLGGQDLGAPDTGDVDLGQPDLGDPDLGSPDLGPPDLGPPVVCGDGVVDPATELCDPGLNACCAADCQSVLPQDASCRAQAGSCDVEEVCDGQSADCPADQFEPDFTPCIGCVGTSSTTLPGLLPGQLRALYQPLLADPERRTIHRRWDLHDPNDADRDLGDAGLLRHDDRRWGLDHALQEVRGSARQEL